MGIYVHRTLFRHFFDGNSSIPFRLQTIRVILIYAFFHNLSIEWNDQLIGL